MRPAGQRATSAERILDRWVGVPFVFLAGLLRRRRSAPKPVRRVAFMKTAAIGDTVLLAGVIEALREKYPDAHLTFFAGPSNYPMALLLPGVDEVVELPLRRPWESVRLIRAAGRFDAWFDFGQWPRLDALLSLSARARFRAGFRTAGQYRHYGYDWFLRHDAAVHELDNLQGLLKPLGVTGGPRPHLEVQAVCFERGYAVVHMFPGGTEAWHKEWPAQNWQEVVDALVARGLKIFLTGGPGDGVRAASLVAHCQKNREVEVAAGTMSLEETAALLKGAAVVVSVNTGVMHLAAALGTPLVSLNGPTSVIRWGGLTERGVALQSPRGCSPCLNLGFEYACETNACMGEILPRHVIEALDRLLARRAGEGGCDRNIAREIS